MHLPNYINGSIVNLTSSILNAFGSRSLYKPLPSLNPKTLQKSRNVVLVVIDGLGYDFVVEHGKDSVFQEKLVDKVTSVFPATSASCITSFMTGLAPQQHAVTGWFVYLKEVGMVSKILPFTPRVGRTSFSVMGIKPEHVFMHKSIFEKIKAQSYIVYGKDIIDSVYSHFYGKRAIRLPYKTLTGFFRQTRKAIQADDKRKFIYAYWPVFDSLCHEHGPSSKKVKAHFKELDRKIRGFAQSLERTDTTLIVTADHGLLDNEESDTIVLEEHPKLQEALTLPLSGDMRTVFCYVHPNKAMQFENYVQKNFSHLCDMFRSENLIKKGFFGLGKPHPKLLERIGDYTLIMKRGSRMKDMLKGEKQKKHKGDHSGVSSAEMYVPLVVFNC